MKLIDSDALLKQLGISERFNNADIPAYVIGIIKGMPSAQPEIIRCKDCKYASSNGKYGCKAYHFKQYEVHEMYADDFCSKGERRENDRTDD